MVLTNILRTLISTACCMALFAACRNEQPEVQNAYNTEESGNSISIRLLARATASSVTDLENDDAEKKFHYLRILVAKADGTEVKVFNFSTKGEQDITPFPTTADGKPAEITLNGVPTGDLMIYAIANEEMLGLDLSQESSWNSLEEITNGTTTKNKLYFLDTNNPKKYPITRSELEVDGEIEPDGTIITKGYCGLPMSWYVANTNGNTRFDVKMKHIVSKVILNVTYTGTTYNSITLKDISFGPFMGDKIYLFEETDQNFPDIPKDSQYETYHFRNINKTLAQNNTITETYYIYPSKIEDIHLAENSYTIGITAIGTEGKEIFYEPKPIIDKNTNKVITGIERNHILKVNITLGEGSGAANFQMTCSVEPWEDKELDIPTFN